MATNSTKGLLYLPTRHEGGGYHLGVETPKGSPSKLKFDPDLGVFTLGRMLTAGTVYARDWGYIHGTLGPDGDPSTRCCSVPAAPFLVWWCGRDRSEFFRSSRARKATSFATTVCCSWASTTCVSIRA